MKSFNKLRMVRKYLKPTLVPSRPRFMWLALFFLGFTVFMFTNNSIEITDDSQLEKVEVTTNILDEVASAPQKPVSTDTIEEDIKEENNESVQLEYVEVQMFTTSSVNLRTQPDSNSDSILVIGNSEILTAQVVDGAEWYYVSYDSLEGYVNSSYLKIYDPEIHLKELGLEYQYQDLIRELIDLYEFDVDEYFFYGMMYTENRFKQEPESEAGAQGVLQIIPSTWKSCYSQFCSEYPEYSSIITNDPSDKGSNIVIGLYYIKYLRDYYGYSSLSEHASQILTAYNRGPDSTKSYFNTYGTYSSGYSKEILRAADYIREHQTWKEGI